MKGLCFKIYKLEKENPTLNGRSLVEIPQIVVDDYNKQKGEIVYDKISDKNKFSRDGLEFIFYKKQKGLDRLPHIWKQYFEDGTNDVDFGKIDSENHHILAFVLNQKSEQAYCISTGAAYVVFEKFIDYDFPLDIARKIVNPEIKSADTKGLTGALMASSLQFRRPRRISSIEGAATIWTQISGYLREEVLKTDSFKNIFGEKSKVGVDVKGSIKLGPKLSSTDKLVDLIFWLEDIEANFPIPSIDDFAFLDAVKKLDRRKTPELVKELEEELNKILVKSEYDNFDLCHQESSRYLNAEGYEAKFEDKNKSYDENPSLESFEEFVKPLNIDSLEKIHIEATHNENFLNVEGSSYDVLCGEIAKDGKVYFLFNKHWYSLKPEFLKLVDQTFENVINDDKYKTKIKFPDWKKIEKEGKNLPQREDLYSESVIKAITDSILGDKVFVDSIELYDVLTWDRENLYIVHIKSGFDVKIRDLSSQIFSSAQIIENSRMSGFKELEEHHKSLISKKRTEISFDNYKKLFSKKINYMFAYGRANQVLDKNIKSSVAKLEVVQLAKDMTRFEGKLKLLWIKQS